MITRRNSIKTIAGSIAFPYLAQTSWAKSPPSEIVNHASFGGAGMAGSDLGQIKTHPNVKIRAIAEIDPAMVLMEFLRVIILILGCKFKRI